MQNKYVGDIGDLGKFYLLRRISETGLRLGINWYLRTDEKNNDGQLRSYASQEESPNTKRIEYSYYEEADKELYRELRLLQDTPSVEAVGASKVFKGDTLYFSKPIMKEVDRENWLVESMSALNDADVVFCDPDNGLEVKSHSAKSKRGGKFVFLNELKYYYDAGKTIVFYQHLPRKRKEIVQSDAIQKIASYLQIAPDSIQALYYSPARFFFVIPQPGHTGALNQCVQDIMGGKMSKAFAQIPRS